MLKAIFFPDSFTVFFWGIVFLLMETATAIHILYNKREEHVSAVFWLLVVYSFPIAGIIFYVLFGINRVFTEGKKIKTASIKFREEKTRQMHNAFRRHLKIRRHIFSLKILGGIIQII